MGRFFLLLMSLKWTSKLTERIANKHTFKDLKPLYDTMQDQKDKPTHSESKITIKLERWLASFRKNPLEVVQKKKI